MSDLSLQQEAEGRAWGEQLLARLQMNSKTFGEMFKDASLLLDAAAALQSRDQRIKELEARLDATEEAWGFDRERLARLDPRTEQAIRGGEVSTRRKAKSGIVHEMADLGVDFLCGRTAQEPFNWTEEPVTCRQCLDAIPLPMSAKR